MAVTIVFPLGQPLALANSQARGRASLLELLRKDLAGRPDPGCPVILCLTGDFAEIASADEFREAERFIKQLAAEKIFGQPRSLKNIFIVPGNHDLAYGPKELRTAGVLGPSFAMILLEQTSPPVILQAAFPFMTGSTTLEQSSFV